MLCSVALSSSLHWLDATDLVRISSGFWFSFQEFKKN